MGMRGRPGTRRIKTDVFLGINIASSRYSEIAKQRKQPVKHDKEIYPHNQAHN